MKAHQRNSVYYSHLRKYYQHFCLVLIAFSQALKKKNTFLFTVHT